MKIDKRLNLVIPVEIGTETVPVLKDGKPVMEAGKPVTEAKPINLYVHSQPISKEVFEQHFEVIGQVFSAIHGDGYGSLAGPRLAAMLLKKIAISRGAWEGPLGVDAGIMNEIRRLSMVILPAGETLTLQEAMTRHLIEQQDIDVLENAIVFFIVVCAMHRPPVARGMMAGAAGLWSAQITSLDSTEFARSLLTSTETGSSGAKATGS